MEKFIKTFFQVVLLFSSSKLIRLQVKKIFSLRFFFTKIFYSSVVMKYFVSDEFRLLDFLTATKGAACRELYVWYFDFSVHERATRARHAVYYI